MACARERRAGIRAGRCVEVALTFARAPCAHRRAAERERCSSAERHSRRGRVRQPHALAPQRKLCERACSCAEGSFRERAWHHTLRGLGSTLEGPALACDPARSGTPPGALGSTLAGAVETSGKGPAQARERPRAAIEIAALGTSGNAPLWRFGRVSLARLGPSERSPSSVGERAPSRGKKCVFGPSGNGAQRTLLPRWQEHSGDVGREQLGGLARCTRIGRDAARWPSETRRRGSELEVSAAPAFYPTVGFIRGRGRQVQHVSGVTIQHSG